jgi:peptidoglycan/xylan/chitin deacetylase (PgdA/CDA1 family)
MTVVLMYHGVGDQPTRASELRYTVKPADFARQMQLLATSGRVVDYPELVRGAAPPGAVAVTFDDGERSVATTALPVMRELGLRGTLFVTSGWIGSEGYVDGDHLRELSRQGWTVGTHGATHRYLSDLAGPELERELDEPRQVLGQILGAAPEHMSLPGGRADGRVVRAVKRAGYASLGTSRVGQNHPGGDPFGIRRVMIQRGFGPELFRGIVEGRRRVYLGLQARQWLLDSAKRALGNRAYDLLRRAVQRS